MAMQGWWKQLKRIGLALLLWQTALGLSWAQNIGWFGAQQTHTVRTDAVTARLLAWAPQGVAEGQMLWLGLHMQHAPGWHTYWKNPGQAGMATSLQWQLPTGWEAGEIAWPVPAKFMAGGLVNFGYADDVLLAVPVRIPALQATDTVPIVLQANWLACRTECVPQQGELRLQLPLGQPLQEHAAIFAANQKRLPIDLTGKAAIKAAANSDGSSVVIKVTGLPTAWQGKTLSVYPEAWDVFDVQATARQSWQGHAWQLDLPLNPQRMHNPDDLALVLAVQGSAHADADSARAAQQALAHWAYRLQTPLSGGWPTPANMQAQADTNTEVAKVAPTHSAGEKAQAETVPPAVGASASITAVGWGWWLSMGGALLGGLLLNLMPCVFPVLGIKVLGFAQHAHSVRELRLTGILYAVGCIASFLALAAVLLVLRAGGEQLGWGFQLQNPYVVVALAVLFTVLALNFLGMFEVGQWLPATWQNAGNNRSVGLQAFASGVLSVLVASPCSAPFVGAALGFALNLPAWQALAVFACLGLGLALPVLLISFAPAMLRQLPKPGQWMLVLREWMAFPMLITVVWLAWVLGQQRGVGSMATLLGMLVLLSGLLWAWQLQGWSRRLGVVFFALALLGMGALQGKELTATPVAAQATIAEEGWQPWSPERVQAALQAGQPVLVNYTAAWCITCQFNQKNVFDQEAFAQLARQNRVVLLKADWTRSDPAITASLRSLGRAAVPTYAIYRPGQSANPQVLTELLTIEQIRRALQNG